MRAVVIGLALYLNKASATEDQNMRKTRNLVLATLLTVLLSGCVLTKLGTVPLRVIGAAGVVIGAVVSIVPVVGNTANSALLKGNGAINELADNIDNIPI